MLREPTPLLSAKQANPENAWFLSKNHPSRQPLTCCISSNKLAQKPHIARIKAADFADAVLHHRDALDAHAEGESGDLFRVVGGLLFGREGEDRGVNHTATKI